VDPIEILDLIFGLEYLVPKYELRWSGKDLDELSPGERGTLLLIFYLLIDKRDTPLIIDQPEENLDNQTVYNTLVPCLREARKRRQVIIVTHNPNLAVVCDADQIIHAQIDKQHQNKVTYTSGAIENPTMNLFSITVLEGTRPAFDQRESKYQA
jgi:predicted ATPase